jgi:motility quorum-sensing regulator/GCU-specific mRNA interferase toxin
MENGSPHCELSVVQELAKDGNIRSTRSALEGAAALGVDFNGVLPW